MSDDAEIMPMKQGGRDLWYGEAGPKVLAARVLYQTKEDMRGAGADQRSDIICFVMSDLFEFWCDLAGVDPDVVRAEFLRRWRIDRYAAQQHYRKMGGAWSHKRQAE